MPKKLGRNQKGINTTLQQNQDGAQPPSTKTTVYCIYIHIITYVTNSSVYIYIHTYTYTCTETIVSFLPTKMITSQEHKSLATQKCTESGPKKPAARALDLVARKTNSTIGNALGGKKAATASEPLLRRRALCLKMMYPLVI